MEPIVFTITHGKPISEHFLEKGLTTFQQVATYISNLPYKRNSNKYDLTTVFTDGCGTCGTKHALLKMLIDENAFPGVQLIMGIIKMDAIYSPKIADTLEKYKLDYMPEAHNYLRYNGEMLDYTTTNSKPENFINNLIVEIEIQPNQVTDFKVAYHKDFLSKWLVETQSPYSLDEIWKIREQCIADLAS